MDLSRKEIYQLLKISLLLILTACTAEMVYGEQLLPLFVFGDSHLDTGNADSSIISRKFPYGISWPGFPTGRFSDGYTLTDLIAKRIYSSAIPHKYLDNSRKNAINGVNFAVGGNGVLSNSETSFSMQVDQLQSIIPVYKAAQAKIPVIVSFGADNYINHLQNNGSISGLSPLVVEVVDEIISNLQRIYNMGLRRFVVSNLGRLDCLPIETASLSYSQCRTEIQPLITFHNHLLVQRINTMLENLSDAEFVILDQNKAFSFVMDNASLLGIKEVFKPCCMAKTEQAKCGEIGKQGEPLYNLCSNPQNYLFWDDKHLTQAGWQVITSVYYNSTLTTLPSWMLTKSH